MRVLTGKTYTRITDRGGGLGIRDVRFEHCTFDNCRLSLVTEPDAMTSVSHVEFADCSSLNSTMGPCRLTDVTVTNLRTGDLLIAWSPLCERVTLTGKIGRLKLNARIHAPGASAAQQAAFQRLRTAHYAAVDWSLDISRARCLLLEIDGIPADTVRRDPETQIVVRRSRLSCETQLAAVRGLDQNTAFILEGFVAGDRDDIVLVAPIGRPAKAWRPVLASFALLRAAALADPA